MENQKITKRVNKKKISKTNKVSVLSQFNLLGAFTWLNLSTMKKNQPYLITQLRRQKTKFGDRLLAELDENNRLYLPERYNTLTDKQIQELSGNKFCLINWGMMDGKFYKLELIPKSDQMKQKDSMEQESPASPLPSTATTSATLTSLPPPPQQPSMQTIVQEEDDDDDDDEEDDSEDEADMNTINKADLIRLFHPK